MEEQVGSEMEHPDLICTCHTSESSCSCDDLGSLTIKSSPKILLPSFGIDFEKGDESSEAYQGMFRDQNVRVVIKNLARCSSPELGKSIEIIEEAEMRLNSLNEADKLTEKICLLFKFHGKQMTIGRFHRNCPIELQKGDLVVLTVDDRYRFCSYKEIMFVNNLTHFVHRPITIGSLISIEGVDSVIFLKVVKIIGQHVTCCIKTGGKLKSYSEVIANVPSLNCLTYTDLADCDQAVQHAVDGVILPSVSDDLYISQVRKHLDTKRDKHILIFAEVDVGKCYCPEKFCSIIDVSDGLYFNEECHDALTEELLLAARCSNKLVLWTYVENNLNFCNQNLLLVPDCFIVTKRRHRSPDLHTTETIEALQTYIDKVHTRIYEECCNEKTVSDPICLISVSSSGCAAKNLSNVRDRHPIVCVSNQEATVSRLHLYKGVKPFYFDWDQKMEMAEAQIVRHLLHLIVEWIREQKLLTGPFCIKNYLLQQRRVKIDVDSEQS